MSPQCPFLPSSQGDGISVSDNFGCPTSLDALCLARSNVGKSSLVNSVLLRKALAPVAAMPGKTTRFHFYAVNEKSAMFPRSAPPMGPFSELALTGDGTRRTEQRQ